MVGCQSTYYSAMEKVGIHKRDIMVDRLESTQSSQEEAQQQFQSALEQFRSVVNFDGGDIEEAYNTLNSEYEKSSGAAQTVRDRIASVSHVSEALFDEWEDELDLYSNKSLKQSSVRKLKETRKQYEQMMKNLKQAEASMKPVLDAMQDQVLFLKHNLNTQAISALKKELNNIEVDIEALIANMQKSIRGSRKMISTLKR
nr:DUF2959 domain-containing protein [Sansalvadorimonas sp. 2012CJ34-2]